MPEPSVAWFIYLLWAIVPGRAPPHPSAESPPSPLTPTGNATISSKTGPSPSLSLSLSLSLPPPPPPSLLSLSLSLLLYSSSIMLYGLPRHADASAAPSMLQWQVPQVCLVG